MTDHFKKTFRACMALSGRSEEEELEVVHKLCDLSKPYTLEGRSVLGRVSRVIDGDSLHVSMPIDGHVWTFPCVIRNIDCPEIRTKNIEEKALGFKAKKHVEEILSKKIISLDLGEFDSFGRLLVSIHTSDGVNVADSLVENGFARVYNGGKKEPWF